MSLVLWYSMVAFQCLMMWKLIFSNRGFCSLCASLFLVCIYVAFREFSDLLGNTYSLFFGSALSISTNSWVILKILGLLPFSGVIKIIMRLSKSMFDQRSEFAKILEKARNTRYIRCPYLAMRDASLIAFEFLFKIRVSEGVGRVFPEDWKDRLRSQFLDKYEGIRLNDFEVATIKGREVLRYRLMVLKRGCRKKICKNCGTRNDLTANFCKKCGSTLVKVKFDSRLKEHYVWDSVRLDDSFTYYIIEWLDFLRQY